MNKLFTKIAALALGATMAVGVGVAVGSSGKVDRADAAAGDVLKTYDTNSSTFTTGYKRQSGDNFVWWGQKNYYGANNATNHGNFKPTAADLPVVKAQDSTATTSTTGLYYLYTSEAVAKVGSLQIYLSAKSGSGTVNAYVVSSSTAASSGSATWSKVTLDASSSSAQGANVASASTYTFKLAETETSSKYYGVVFKTTTYWRATGLTFKLIEGTTQTTYSVGGTITNGALSSTERIVQNSPLDINLVPNEHYHFPTSLTSVTMGGNTLVAGTDYTYTAATGRIQISAVTGDVVINATCPPDSKYDVIYTAGTNGSGTFTISDQWAGSYTLPEYSVISGSGKVNANEGYAFKDYTVGGETKNPGETITLSSLTNVTVNFKVQPKEAKYEPSSATAASMTEGIAPTGSGIAFNNTYTNNKVQVTANNTMTWTLTGYTGYNIKSIKAHARNNKSSGAATATLTNNATSVTPLERSSFSGLGDTYAEYEILKSKIEVKGNVVLTFSCSTSSLFCDYILVEWEQSNVLSEDLIIDNPTTSFTVGDIFEIGDTVYANYSISGDVDVTSDVTLDLAGVGTISEGDTVSASWVGTKEVGVYYEDEDGAEASAAYDITVSYAKVTSVEITNHPSTGELPKDGTFTFGATVLPATANPAVKWSASSETLVENDDFYIDEDTGELTLTASEGGSITITATTVGKTAGDVTLSDTYDLEVTGDPVVTLNYYVLAGYSGKSGSLTAEAANFGGTVTYSWSSDNACVTVPNNNVATNTLTYVSAGTAIITVTATYQSQSASASCTVTVTASQVTSVTWTSASDMTVYSGSTALNAAKISSWGPHYEMNNGDSGTVSSNYTVQLNGDPYTLGTALEAGIYSVSLSYGGQTTLVNPTLTVVQRLNTINASDTYLWEANGTTDDFTSASTTLNGVVWTNTVPVYTNKAAGTTEKRYIQIGKGSAPEDFTISTSAITGTISKVTVDCASGDNKHTIAISVGGTTYLEATQTPRWSSNTGGEMSGTGSSSGEIVITFDHADNTKAMYIHSIKVESSGDIANSDAHISTQAKVVEFAQYMNTQMNGTDVCTGDMSNLGTAWSNVSGKYDELFGSGEHALSGEELIYAKKMLKNATANWDESHDSDERYCLEKAMKTYEWCVSHYAGTCDPFMFESDGSTPLRSINVGGEIKLFVTQNSSAITIIVITSLVSLTAIGGYFFLRKRREKN